MSLVTSSGYACQGQVGSVVTQHIPSSQAQGATYPLVGHDQRQQGHCLPSAGGHLQDSMTLCGGAGRQQRLSEPETQTLGTLLQMP